MRRNATLLVVLALLVGSAAAFAVAERLKLERSPVAGPSIDKVFSPVCDCPQERARIAFRLRRADRLTLSLLDSTGNEIRTLVDHERAQKGRYEVTWDGRGDDGRLVSEGSYRPRIVLGDADRTIVLPNPIRVDVTRPVVVLRSVRPRVISPDGDGRRDVARARYRASERARVTLLVNGFQRVVSRSRRPAGQLEWHAGGSGVRRLPAGDYRLAVQAQDLAGNVSAPSRVAPVRIRYVELGADRLNVAPGARVRVRVHTDVRRVRWRLLRGAKVVAGGTAARTVAFRAPSPPGRYVLVVEAGSHEARSAIIVRRRS